LVGACDSGVSRSEFIEQYEVLFCQSYAICASEEMRNVIDERECLEYMRYEPYPEGAACMFEPSAAEQCVSEMAASGCIQNDPEIPLICADVFSQCALPRVPVRSGANPPIP
jgi:hypothetical protein